MTGTVRTVPAQTVTVRPERPQEFARVEEIHRLAFGGPNEAQVVANVRRSSLYSPAYSLVGLLNEVGSDPVNRVVGHILFSPVGLEDEGGTIRRVLVLGRLAVHPDFHRRGVASALIRAGVEQAEANGEAVIVVRGWDRIYGPFGFTPASEQGITPPADLPARQYLARPLMPTRRNIRASFAAVGYPVEWEG